MNGSLPPSKSSKKFMFDINDFNDDVEEEEEEEVEPPPPTFSEEELANAKQKSYDDGFKRAAHEAEQSREKQVSEYCGLITQHVTDLFSQEEERVKIYETEAVKLSEAIFKQIFPVMNAQHGLEEIKAVIVDVLERHYENPSITITVPDEYLGDIDEFLKTRLDDALAKRITVNSNDKLGLSDCKVSWNNGGARRSATIMAENIKQQLQQMLAEQSDITHNEERESEHSPDTSLDKPAETAKEDNKDNLTPADTATNLDTADKPDNETGSNHE
jgi:flagellar assembly protein FliH